MTVEVLPYGFSCGSACTYCYQENTRKQNAAPPGRPNYTAIKAEVDRQRSNWSLFGGEPLLIPIDEIREMLTWRTPNPHGEDFRCNGIQTDGHLMTEEHIQLFVENKVHVGFSIDGPGSLNDARPLRNKSIEESRGSTDQTMWAIVRLLELGEKPSIIATMHKYNCSAERLPIFKEWILDLQKAGLSGLNMHSLEVDLPEAAKIALPQEEAFEVYKMCADLYFDHGLSVSPITDWLSKLRNSGSSNCVWNGCDNHSTSAVQGIDPQGLLSNCGRTNKHGVRWAKSSEMTYERYFMLRRTPMEYGGCEGCKFWVACKGACPGEAELGDWRGKTEHCESIKLSLAYLEQKLLDRGETPITSDPTRLVELEKQTLDAMDRGHLFGGGTIEDPHEDSHFDHRDQHGDHTDSLTTNNGEYDGHGDSHGDHVDAQHQDHWDSESR